MLSPQGAVVVPTQTIRQERVEAIERLRAPNERGLQTLRLWLSDAEGNVGAPVSVPLAYSCPRSEPEGGIMLSAALGEGAEADREVVPQHRGALLRGRLAGPGGGVAGASVCVFSRTVTDSGREFAGIAISDADGRYGFAVPPGPSRELSAVYRAGHRELSAQAMLHSRVRPVFKVRKRVVRNKGVAHFYGQIPGPHNDRVVVVLQVKQGKGWRAFRRYRTRSGGRFAVKYRFNRTSKPSRYVMRAQVRHQVGYPYLQGNSRHLLMRVIP